MRSFFPLFSSHLQLAHSYWHRLLRPGDCAIDATCGNGKDTLELARLVLKDNEDGLVFSLDIQETALQNARVLLAEHLTLSQMNRVHFLRQSHVEFPLTTKTRPVRLIVYNLGYLPGGDKTLTTITATTLMSVEQACHIVMPGGAISITCYPGHPEGFLEQEALLAWIKQLSSSVFNICFHSFPNRKTSPSLLLIQKTYN